MSDSPLDWIDRQLAQVAAGRLQRLRVTRRGPQAARVVVDDQTLLNFASNDYLGLASDKRLAAAVAKTLTEEGWGSGASPLITGRGGLASELERQLARFEHAEAALLFPSGFAANLGAITALVDRGDLILSDANNHASIIDGCRLSRARVEVYRHRDVDHVRGFLKEAGRFRRRLVVTDALFSMDGDLAPLAELAELAEQFGAMLLADEAHATGVFGREGRGAAEHTGAETGVHVRVGTLSKALGSVGGFVAGSVKLIDWLVHCARTYMFSTAPPEAASAAALAALQIVASEPFRRRQLLDKASWVRDRLRQHGWPLDDCQSQIIPLVIGDPGRAMDVAGQLRRRGILVPGIRPPSVPVGQSRLRISLSFLHDEDELGQLTDALSELAPRRPCVRSSSHVRIKS